MTSIELLKEIESWLSFNTEPSKEETAKLRKSIKDHMKKQKIQSSMEDDISVRNFLTSVGQQKIELIKEYLEPTGITIKELIDRNAFASLCQLLDAYLLEAVRNGR